MKRFITLFLVAGFVFAFSSCKKDYTCECNYDDGTTTQSISYTINDTKKNATDMCDSYATSVTVGTETFTWACDIK